MNCENSNCAKLATNICCTNCKIKYCSAKCKKDDRKGHKKTCEWSNPMEKQKKENNEKEGNEENNKNKEDNEKEDKIITSIQEIIRKIIGNFVSSLSPVRTAAI